MHTSGQVSAQCFCTGRSGQSGQGREGRARAGRWGPGGTHVATGPAVVAAACQGVKGLLAAHAHGHHLVPHPLGRPEAQLHGLQLWGSGVGTSGPPAHSPWPWALCPPTCGRASAVCASQRLPHEGEQTDEDHTWGKSISPRPEVQVRKLRPERSRDPVKTPIRPLSELRAEIVRDTLRNCHPTCLPLSLGLAFFRHFQNPNLQACAHARTHTHPTPHSQSYTYRPEILPGSSCTKRLP